MRVLLVLLIYGGLCRSEVLFKFNNVKCSATPSLIKNFTCVLKAHGRNNVTSHVHLTLLKKIPTAFVHIQLFKFYNQYRPFFINHDFNYCDIANGTFSAFYSSLVMSSIRDTNLFLGCPYYPQDYYANNIYFEPKLLQRLPDVAGEYRIDITFFLRKNAGQIAKIAYTFAMWDDIPKRRLSGKHAKNTTQSLVASGFSDGLHNLSVF